MGGLTPPRLARGILCALLPEEDREAILGDLLEEWREGRSAAWYWSQVMRSGAWMVWARSTAPSLMAAVMWGGLGAIVTFLLLTLGALLVLRPLAVPSAIHVVAFLVAVSLGGGIGGWCVRRSGGSDPVGGMLLTFVLWCGVVGLFRASTEVEPLAWTLIWWALVALGVTTGWSLADPGRSQQPV